MMPKGKPTNKIFRQVLRKLRLRKQTRSPENKAHDALWNRQENPPTLPRRRGMIGLMKYNHKKNLWTDRQRRRGEGPAHAVSFYCCPESPTSPPRAGAGGVLRSILLLEYVWAKRYATTGRIGLGLHRTTWAALCSIGSWRDSTEGASYRPDLV